MRSVKERELFRFKFGKIKFWAKKDEAFVFYAAFIANEYKDLRIRKNDIVLDLGANVGDFTVKAGILLSNTGKIITIEPDHENVEIMKMNLELNEIKNVEIMEVAITDRNGSSYLSGNGVGSEVSDIFTDNKIKTISVDSLLEKLHHPNNLVVKMDIEGGERYFFNNQEFVNSIREIAMELHGKENIQTIPRILEKNNFKIKRYTAKDEYKNTLKSILLHPINFIHCERLSGYIAIKGAIDTLKNKKNPIPSINNEELMVIYAYK